MGIRIEVLPFLLAALVAGILLVLLVRLFRVRARSAAMAGGILAVILGFYFAWFFRDPTRIPPNDPSAVLAAADGRIAKIMLIRKDDFLDLCKKSGLSDEEIGKLGRLRETDSIRISIFLSLFDVHVNRAPISGSSEFLRYSPGKRFFTFQEKSSSENQHNAIVMRNGQTCCLINQIVGPVCRRVVYWPSHDKPIDLKIGDRIGMMKFGSRLDMYLPKVDISLVAKEGDKVAAGLSVVARLKAKENNP